MSQQDIINQIRKTMPKQIASAIAGVQPMGSSGGVFNVGSPALDTWQSYLSRLGHGINGVAERSQNVTEADIVANAHKWMQTKYPGPYRVEQYYNSDKMKWDLRLKFEDSNQELLWKIKWS